MIRNVFTYLTLILSCGTLLGDESLTQSYFRCGSMTALAVQEQSKKLIPQFESQLKAVHNGLKMEAGKPFFEQLAGKWVYHFVTEDEKTAELKSLESKLEKIKIEGAKEWLPPRLPQAFLVVGDVGMIDASVTATLRWDSEPAKTEVTHIDPNGFVGIVTFGDHLGAYFAGFDTSKLRARSVVELRDVVVVLGQTDTPHGRYMTLRKLTDEELDAAKKFAAKTTHKPDLRQWRDTTGSHTVSAEFVEVEKFDVVLRKANGVIIRVPLAKLSKEDRDWIKANRNNPPPPGTP